MLSTSLKGLLDNIGRISPYTPLYEAIMNSIHSIEESKRTDGKITIKTIRESQSTMTEIGLPLIKGFIVEDNGIGFTPENFESFQTAYTQKKIELGGKGVGRFMFLKVFTNVKVDSVYEVKGEKKRIKFDFNIDEDGISEPKISNVDIDTPITTVISLLDRQDNRIFDKQIETIARLIIEHFLLYFDLQDKYFPKNIVIEDEFSDHPIELNDYFGKTDDIVLDDNTEFECLAADKKSEKFTLKVFKVFYSTDQNSLNLCAHKRQVISAPLANFVPEFHKHFTATRHGKHKETVENQYALKAYIIGNYLDQNVNKERSEFKLPKEGPDLFCPIGQRDIEKVAAAYLKGKYGGLLEERYEKKKARIDRYIDDLEPWYKHLRSRFDYSHISEEIPDSELKIELFKQKADIELQIKIEAKEILESESLHDDEKINEIMKKISDMGKADLAHYVISRKVVLDLFKKNLRLNDENRYEPEDAIHNVIFPMRDDSESVHYEGHNLWLLDERLNFHTYLASDQPLKSGKEPDVLIFNQPIVTREGSEPSNPVIIFEFKKPEKESYKKGSVQRTDDPIKQITEYAEEIRAGKVKDVEGRTITVLEHTPFYGYVVCDLNQKARRYFEKDWSMIPSPDGQGFFAWNNGYNIYLEVMSFEKLLKDATSRSSIFFKKLGIE